MLTVTWHLASLWNICVLQVSQFALDLLRNSHTWTVALNLSTKTLNKICTCTSLMNSFVVWIWWHSVFVLACIDYTAPVHSQWLALIKSFHIQVILNFTVSPIFVADAVFSHPGDAESYRAPARITVIYFHIEQHICIFKKHILQCSICFVHCCHWSQANMSAVTTRASWCRSITVDAPRCWLMHTYKLFILCNCI